MKGLCGFPRFELRIVFDGINFPIVLIVLCLIEVRKEIVRTKKS